RTLAEDDGHSFHRPYLHQRKRGKRAVDATADGIDVENHFAAAWRAEQIADHLRFPVIDIADDGDLGRLVTISLALFFLSLGVHVVAFSGRRICPLHVPMNVESRRGQKTPSVLRRSVT